MSHALALILTTEIQDKLDQIGLNKYKKQRDANTCISSRYAFLQLCILNTR
jgi:hypothetical protein